MPAITLTQAQSQLNAYLAAETAVLTGQKYQIAGRTLERANLMEIQQGIKIWYERVTNLSRTQNGRSRARTVVAGA